MAIAALVSANPSYRVLIITYRVVLATKMCEELNRDSDLDFKVYYEEERGELIAGRLVAQIDSIARVEMSAFDMVVVDEAGSAVGHTCSALIVDPVRVMQCLQFHLAKAGRVILLDACMDDFPGYRLVQCIERLKGVSARWIHNGFVRAPGFTATLHICRASDGTTQAAFKDSAIDAILAYIDEGRRIFVPSSSKAFAVAVHMSIERHCVEREVDPPRVLLITADTSDEVKKATSKDFNAALSAVDVFICSPAIIAGSSFTVPDHFTRVVQFGENGPNKITVDAAIQQGGRIRNLGDSGHKSFYIIDPVAVNAEAGPCDEVGVATWLLVSGCHS